IAVHWDEGQHEGKWTISLNDRSGNFSNGRVATVGGSQQTYRPASQNTALVGDFNGDGFDDIAVHWDEGQHEGKWTISLNDRSGNFSNGRVATVGGNQQTYKPASQNTALVGDFNNDNFDDIAVHWDEGQHEGKWTISLNDRSGNFSSGHVATVGGSQQTYRPASQNTALVGDFNGDGFDDIAVHWDKGQHEGKWTISLNTK
ncbi:VCBS repeat-containing protein, partial [Candidatus Halobeggiatoa sp. HSG11]|nr:VCBS repeat-containing protein [Candidatus Halobeggiatoa sp. HSG11]